MMRRVITRSDLIATMDELVEREIRPHTPVGIYIKLEVRERPGMAIIRATVMSTWWRRALIGIGKWLVRIGQGGTR